MNGLTRKSSTLLRRLKSFVRAGRLLEQGERVLVAVSGGSDSVALLHLLSLLRDEWRLDLHVACVDHGIRPEARQEASHVRSLARRFGLPFHLLRGSAAGEARRRKQSLQHAAREMRYRLLRGLGRRIGADKIATGHTLDDQAETVLMNIIRGCGIDGLAGIDPLREGLFVRPLLCFRRGELMDHLREHSIAFCSDRSNLDESYQRPRIRLGVLPVIERENPETVRLLARLAGEAREVGAYLQSEAERFLRGRLSRRGACWVVPAGDFSRLHPAVKAQVVRQMLLRISSTLLGYYRVHVDDILAAARGRSGSRTVALPGGAVFRREYDDLVFLPAEGAPDGKAAAAEVTVGKSGTFVHAGLGVRIAVKAAGGTRLFPIVLRGRKEGDRLSGRKRTLKKLLIDSKVPRSARDQVPLLAKGKEILWAAGLFTAGARRLRVTMKPHGPPTPYLLWLRRRGKELSGLESKTV
jgi:tRNA(Ile)-lysidine synthase